MGSSMGAFKVPVTRSGYVIVLSKELKSPLAPQSDEEKPEPEPQKTGTADKPKDLGGKGDSTEGGAGCERQRSAQRYGCADRQ